MIKVTIDNYIEHIPLSYHLEILDEIIEMGLSASVNRYHNNLIVIFNNQQEIRKFIERIKFIIYGRLSLRYLIFSNKDIILYFISKN